MKLKKDMTIRLNGDNLQLYIIKQSYRHGQTHMWISRLYIGEAVNDRDQPTDLPAHDLPYLFGLDEMPPMEIFENHDSYREQLMEEWSEADFACLT